MPHVQKQRRILFFYLLCLHPLFTPVRADMQCGAGKIAALSPAGSPAGTLSCLACGDEVLLRAAGNYSAACLANLGSIYCTATDSNASCTICAAANTVTVAAEPAAATDCVCNAGFYGPPVACAACPADTHSAAGAAAAATDCVCNAGFHGPAGGPCTQCRMGHYCPGDGTEYECAGRLRTDPAQGAGSATACKPPECGNGVLEPGEECDSGSFSEDGCSGFCKFEDPCHCSAGAAFVCTNASLAKTECCPALQHPQTHEYVCSCADSNNSTVPGYVITDNCELRDVNECNTNNGGCAPDAVCQNAAPGNHTHVCICPPGMLGDGVTRCDIFLYETHMAFQLVGLNVSHVNANELRDMLAAHPSVFPGRAAADILVSVSAYGDSALERPVQELGSINHARRRLLSAHGVHVKVIVISQDAAGMQNITAGIDANGITQLLANWYDVAVNVLDDPENAIQTADSVYGTVSTVLTGFSVDGIVYNHSSLEWLVTVSYVADSPNTVTSLYVTRSGGNPPYAQEVSDSFHVAKHPCMESTSVCCLLDYATDYNIGVFAGNISSALGTCDSAMQARDTAGLFHPSGNNDILLGALDGLSESYVTRLSNNQLQLHIGRFALRNQIATREVFTGGYKLDFFVGMSYYTVLPTNALATVATQTNVYATMTDAVTFATTSEQDYSFLEYITMALFQTKYVEPSLLVEHRMQFVKVGLVFPQTLQQNMQTGLVPLTSVRFAISKTLPAVTDLGMWTNPCYSAAGDTGLFDNSSSALRELYTLASHQPCALQSDFCRNPIAQVLPSGLVEFWFPLGDARITDALLAESSQYSLYVYMDVSLYDDTGHGNIITKLFAQAPLSQLSFARACEELKIAQTLADAADVDLNIGMAAQEADWAGSVTSLQNLIATTDATAYLDTGVTIHAKSAQSGLMTIVVKGATPTFEAPVAAAFHLEIEDMVSMHFLEPTKYASMQALLAAGTAYEMVRHGDTGWLEIAFTSAAADLCGTETMPGDFTCAVRKNIYQRNVVEPDVVHALATGVGSSNESRTVDWLQHNVLGVSDFAREFATNFTRLTRARHGINDRYRKAWFLSPMYQWVTDESAPAQSVLGLSDHTVLVAIVALEDENPSGARRRQRLLLQVDSGGGGNVIVRQLADTPAKVPMPPVFNAAVDPAREIASHVGAASQPWLLASADVHAYYRPGRPRQFVRDAMQQRLRTQLQSFAQGLNEPLLVQFLASPQQQPHVPHTQQRRRLAQQQNTASFIATDTVSTTGIAQTGMVAWSGTISLLLTQKAAAEQSGAIASDIQASVFRNYLRCAFFIANITTDRAGTEAADCVLSELSEEGEGFIENFFITACANHTDAQLCNNVVAIMENPPAITPLPQDDSVRDPTDVVGFRVYITITDGSLSVETMSAHQRAEIKAVVAAEFARPMAAIVLTQQSDQQIDNPLQQLQAQQQRRRQRRLLDVGMVWEVLVPLPTGVPENDFDWDAIDIDSKAAAIAAQLSTLGYSVDVNLVSFEPLLFSGGGGSGGQQPTPVATTPLPEANVGEGSSSDGDGDHTNRTLLTVILCIVGGMLISLFFLGYMFSTGYQLQLESNSTKSTGDPAAVADENDARVLYQSPSARERANFRMPLRSVYPRERVRGTTAAYPYDYQPQADHTDSFSHGGFHS